MLSLLHDFPQREYPGDYLLARLQGRRAVMLAEGLSGEHEDIAADISDAAVWARDREERLWLFRQLNTELRWAMAAFFVYFEINILVQCLRFIKAEKHDETDTLLAGSLWSGDLKKILQGRARIEEVIERLERFFRDSPLVLNGLSAAYGREGVQGSEEMIRSAFLTQAVSSRSHPHMHSFFQDLADLRNTITSAKCLRWNLESPPYFIRGGNIRFGSSAKPVSEERLRRMAGRLINVKELSPGLLHPVNLEEVLHDRLLLKVTRLKRGAGKVFACIEYMLRSFQESRKKSIRLHAGKFPEKGTAFAGAGR